MTTRLYQLNPEALGTEDVEAISSYLVRLATLHSTSIGTLLVSIADTHDSATTWLRVAQRAGVGSFIRPNSTSGQLVNLLSKATGIRTGLLRSMSLLAVEHSLARSMGAYAPTMRWCEGCFLERRKSGGVAYAKLLWQLQDVDRCPLHNSPLKDRCPHCGALQRTYANCKGIDRCVTCERLLAVSTSPPVENSWKACVPELRELVAFISANPSIEFPRHGIHLGVKKVFFDACRNGTWREVVSALPAGVYPGVVHEPDFGVTLRMAIGLARALDVPLPNLLMGNIQYTNLPLALRSESSRTGTSKPPPRRKIGNSETLLRKVNQYVELCPQSPSLRSVANGIGISVGGLRYRIPNRCREIVDEHRSAESRRRSEQKHVMKKAIWNEVRNWDALSAAPPSRKGLLRKMREDHGWPKNAVRREIAMAWRENSSLGELKDD